jgi:hypothetical protein
MENRFDNVEEEIFINRTHILWNTVLLDYSLRHEYHTPCLELKNSIFVKDDINSYNTIRNIFHESGCSKCLKTYTTLSNEIEFFRENNNTFPAILLYSKIDFSKIDNSEDSEKAYRHFKDEYFNKSIELLKSDYTFQEPFIFEKLFNPAIYVDGSHKISESLMNNNSAFDSEKYESFLTKNYLLDPKLVLDYTGLIENKIDVLLYLSKVEGEQYILKSKNEILKIPYKKKNIQISKLLNNYIYLLNATIAQQSLIFGNQSVDIAYKYLTYNVKDEKKQLAFDALFHNVYLQENIARKYLYENLNVNLNSEYFIVYKSCFEKPTEGELTILNNRIKNDIIELSIENEKLYFNIKFNGKEIKFESPKPDNVFTGQFSYPVLLFSLVKYREMYKSKLYQLELTNQIFESAEKNENGFSLEQLNYALENYRIESLNE